MLKSCETARFVLESRSSSPPPFDHNLLQQLPRRAPPHSDEGSADFTPCITGSGAAHLALRGNITSDVFPKTIGPFQTLGKDLPIPKSIYDRVWCEGYFLFDSLGIFQCVQLVKIEGTLVEWGASLQQGMPFASGLELFMLGQIWVYNALLSPTKKFKKTTIAARSNPLLYNYCPHILFKHYTTHLYSQVEVTSRTTWTHRW